MVDKYLRDIAAAIMAASAESYGLFEAMAVRIEEGKGNMGTIFVSPANDEHKEIKVILFKKEKEVVLHADTEKAQSFCRQVKNMCSGNMPQLIFEVKELSAS